MLGATPEKADKASEELAGYDNRLATIETRLAVLTWMIGGVYVVITLLGGPALWILLKLATKAGAL